MERWTRPDSYAGFNPEGDYVLLTRCRDSDILDDVNFDVALETLHKITDNSEHVYTWTAWHWAVGWVEYLMIAEHAPEAVIQAGNEIHDALCDYPVLDESRYSDAQFEAANRLWEQAGLRDRIEYCAESGISILAARHDYAPGDATALYELVY